MTTYEITYFFVDNREDIEFQNHGWVIHDIEIKNKNPPSISNFNSIEELLVALNNRCESGKQAR